jgi:hypothetical protein
MRRMADQQPIALKVRIPTHADQRTWDQFVGRAKADGKTLGDLFRGLIYHYAEGKDSLRLPPPLMKK